MHGFTALAFWLMATMDLSQRINQEIRIEGVVSQVPWQHIVASFPGKEAYYFDLEDGSQIVIYAPPEFDCLERAQVTGKVVAVTGGGKGSKSEHVFTEHHIVVSSWQCLDNADVKQGLDRLADSELSRDQKDTVEEEIVKMGKTAIPTLVQHLQDPRISWTERVLANEGEMMNRPVNAPPVAEDWRENQVTIGMRTERMLLRIITPQYESPHQKNFKPFSAGRDSWMFRVEDWRVWWAAARYRSLAGIHEQMKKVIDAYWLSHGTEQIVR